MRCVGEAGALQQVLLQLAHAPMSEGLITYVPACWTDVQPMRGFTHFMAGGEMNSRLQAGAALRVR